MAFFGKLYTHYKHENFEEFLRAVGMPEDKLKTYLSVPATFKITQNGDSYTIVQTGVEGTKEFSFKSGVEFNETIGGRDSATTYTVEGNTVTQVLKTAIGQATFKREFNGDELLVTITGDNFDGVARRYYKA